MIPVTSRLQSSIRASARRARLVPLVMLAGLCLPAPAAAAQDVDFLITKLEVNQAIQTGNTPLVAGRSTFVRTSVRVTGPGAGVVPVDGLLRVFVNGEEAAWSPVFSDNGPYPAKTLVNPAQENDTLNFIFLPPASNNVVLAVQINPPGPNFVPESNLANNVFTSAPLVFTPRGTPDFAYAPIDYRPSGGAVPNLPNPALTRPGVGDSFLHAIYPVADWHYHRTDAPSKLWTSSLASSGSSLLNSLQVDINLMVPKPRFLYGWVPGALPGYNGQAVINGNVSMGNTEPIRFQRTLAHEVGHNVGLLHNTTTTNLVGVDVERHLNLTQGLPRIKVSSLKDIMYAGLLTQEAWVASGNYIHFLNHSAFAAGSDSQALAAETRTPKLMVAGVWEPAGGRVELTDVLWLPSGEASAPAAPAETDLLLVARVGDAEVLRLPLAVRDSSDDCAECGAEVDPDADTGTAAAAGADSPAPPAQRAFWALLEAPAGGHFDSLELLAGGARAVTPLHLKRSATPPAVRFLAPADGRIPAAAVTVAWEVIDPDGDTPISYLRYSPDGERFVPLLTSTTATTAQVDFASLPSFTPGQGFLEVRVSDGLHTTVARSAPLVRTGSFALSTTNAPWAHIVSPDSGLSFRQGATVILHASGWDLEDRALDGPALTWTSSMDGALGSGRLTTATQLSPGSHLLTLTATDSSGLQASDSVSITVLPRGLPTILDTLCQADLGSGGPGSAQLSVCGEALGSGGTASLLLSGAPAFTAALLIVGPTQASLPFKGGTLVPVPWTSALPLFTDATGGISLPDIPGGGGPLSLYMQCVLADASQPGGVGLSNAVRVDLLP